MSVKYTNALRVLREMLAQRGLDEQRLEHTRLGIVLTTSSNLKAIFVHSRLFNAGLIMNLFGWCREQAVTHVMVIHSGSATHATKRIIDHNAGGILTELFTYSELQINITQHSLVPVHRRLSLAEQHELSGRFATKHFPSLLALDPISRFYNFRVGDVIEITRNDGIIIYRVVTAGSS